MYLKKYNNSMPEQALLKVEKNQLYYGNEQKTPKTVR